MIVHSKILHAQLTKSALFLRYWSRDSGSEEWKSSLVITPYSSREIIWPLNNKSRSTFRICNCENLIAHKDERNRTTFICFLSIIKLVLTVCRIASLSCYFWLPWLWSAEDWSLHHPSSLKTSICWTLLNTLMQ